MNMRKTVIALLLLTALLLTACGSAAAPAPTAAPTEAPTAAPTEAPTAAPTEAPTATPAPAPIRVSVLNGTTGFGMAQLMSEGKDSYDFTVETDASVITAGLVSGDVDIAALPTNAAAALFNKTQGGVQLIALNTRGVLYLVANTEKESVTGWEELAGKTVYVPAQNPTFLFKALVDASGADVTIDNTYAAPADLRTALAAGEVDLAVLPEPMVTIACAANDKLQPVMDLTTEWEDVQQLGELVQGCAVVRTAYVQEHKDLVDAFLADYGASVAFVTENPAEAGAMIEAAGLFAKGAVAAKAIPNCNLCFITGAEMESAMDSFLNALFAVQPAAVGGAVPGESFYYLG